MSKIKPYVLSLIKENIVYIILCAVLVTLICLFVPFNLARISANADQMNTTKRDINDLKMQLASLEAIHASDTDLTTTMKFLNTLIPQSEDYFSIIYTLDALSRESGFSITGYSINLSASTKNKLLLSITGIGSTNAFLKFLNDYNYNGGRFITLDKIELSQQTLGKFKVGTTFYSQKTSPSSGERVSISPATLQDLIALQNKVSYVLKEHATATSEASVNLNYPRKNNPF